MMGLRRIRSPMNLKIANKQCNAHLQTLRNNFVSLFFGFKWKTSGANMLLSRERLKRANEIAKLVARES